MSTRHHQEDQEFQVKVKRAKCPRCKTKGRLLPGPSYDRGGIVCCQCGHRFSVKAPKLPSPSRR